MREVGIAPTKPVKATGLQPVRLSYHALAHERVWMDLNHRPPAIMQVRSTLLGIRQVSREPFHQSLFVMQFSTAPHTQIVKELKYCHRRDLNPRLPSENGSLFQ